MAFLSVQRWFWRIAFRQLLAPTGGSRSTPARWTVLAFGLIGSAAAAAVVARLAAAGASGTLPVSLALPWLSAAGVLVFAGTTLAALCAMTDDYPVRQALVALPLSERSIMLGVVAPTVVTVCACGALLLPALVVGLGTLTGTTPARLVQPVAGSLVLGSAVGLLLATAARVVARRLGGSRGLAYPLGVVTLVGLGVATVVALRGGGPAALWWRAVLVPASAGSFAEAAPGGTLVPAGCGLLLAGWLYCSVVPGDLGRATGARPMIVWSPTWPLALFWLEVLRLSRHPRLVGSLLAVGAVALGGLLWLSRVSDPATRLDVLGAVLTISAATLVHPFLLLSTCVPRPYPPQLLLGESTVRWWSRVFGACCLLVGPSVLALLVVTAGPLRALGYAVFSAGVSLLAAALGLAVGVVRPLAPGAVAAETGLLMAAVLLLYALLLGLGHIYSAPASLGAACSVAGLVALVLAGVTERRELRWCR